MEIFGGFMVMMSILGFFLAIIWLIMPFVVLTIKGKQDRTLDLLENINARLTALEQQLAALRNGSNVTGDGAEAVADNSPQQFSGD